jgi:hypothetical protein
LAILRLNYFLRLIDQIAIMLAEIARRAASGDRGGAQAEISEQCRQTIGWISLRFSRCRRRRLGQLLEAEPLLKDSEIRAGDLGRVSRDRRHAFCLLSCIVDSLDTDDQRVYQQKLGELRGFLSELSDNPYGATKLVQFAAPRL